MAPIFHPRYPWLTAPLPRSDSRACTTAPTSAAAPGAHFRQGNRLVPLVANLFRAPQRSLPMQELEAAELVSNRGLAGCSHARPGGKRQVLLVDKETLDAADLKPGVIRENITT